MTAPICKKLDDVEFLLKVDRDLSFLSRYGRVFRVFDRQDSGNISFGVGTGADRVFVKVAGVCTLEYDGNRLAAVDALRRAMPLYETLRHPALIELVEHYPLDRSISPSSAG